MAYPALIKPNELSMLMEKTKVVLIDARYGKNSSQEYYAGHLQGAWYADLDDDLSEQADPTCGGRHPLPKLRNFISFLNKVGITPDSQVIIYDKSTSALAAARLWWMLKSIGHQKVQVLDGGLNAALQYGSTLTKELPTPVTLQYQYPIPTRYHGTIDIKSLKSKIEKGNIHIIDVRSEERFMGLSEPIDPIAGHIPTAYNIPYLNNINKDGTFKPKKELRQLYNSVIDKNQVVVHCGSGVTACHTILALYIAGYPMPTLYVGSWSEWCRNENNMIV